MLRKQTTRHVRRIIALVLLSCICASFWSAAASNQTKTYALGDVNGDGKIISSDARLVLRFAVDLEDLTDEQVKAADADENGTVNTTDARNILRFAVQITLDLKGTPSYTTTTTAPTTTRRDPSTYKIAMLGDSLVATAANYAVRSDQIDYYGKVSLNVYSIFNKKATGSSRYIIDEVSGRNYDIVILHIGINEIDYNNTAWGTQYGKVIDALKERAPGAKIVCSAILPISAAASARNEFGCNNAGINSKNEVIRSVAAEKGVTFIDAGTVLRDASGVLPAGAASDGIHLNKSYCSTWINWTLDELLN